ncbi:MAG: transketolase family protein, partial [Anaerolineales bacterium]
MQPYETKLSHLFGERQSQRNALGNALISLGEEFPELFVLSPDVGPSTKAIRFRDRFPERYVCSGIAEMNTVGLAAGLAYLGYKPLIAGYAMFVAGKAWEPFRNSIAYPNLNVKLVGTHAGINVGPDGVTHQAIEDIALMRSIPNVHVYVPADANQVLPALRRALNIEGPVYIRLEREPLRTLQINQEPGDFHDFYEILPGDDMKLFAIGGMVEPC